jgi:hypothetical protein
MRLTARIAVAWALEIVVESVIVVLQKMRKCPAVCGVVRCGVV